MLQVAGAVALGVAHDGRLRPPPLAALTAQDEDRQRVTLELLPLDREDLSPDELAVVLPLESSWRGAHDARATPVSASKSPCRASPLRRAV